MAHEDPSTDERKSERLYGDNGPDVGNSAVQLLESIDGLQHRVAEGHGERTWLKEDYEALECWLELEWYIPFLESSEVEVDDAIELMGHIDTVRSAVPFTSAERHWLTYTYRNKPDDYECSRLRDSEISLISGGVRQVVQGRDLMRRWQSWCRQTDEFQGQGSLEIAQDALQKIGLTLTTLEYTGPQPHLKDATTSELSTT